MKFDPQIHHRRSIRLKGYDYSQAGAYFITICCDDRKCLFGKISDGKMILNDLGKIAHDEWLRTPDLRKNIELDAFIVMPNHIHGIILITQAHSRTGVLHTPQLLPSITPDLELNTGESDSLQREFDSYNDGDVFNTPRHESDSHQREFDSYNDGDVFNTPQTLRSPSQTIGAIVRGYKSSVTKKINEYYRDKGECNSPQRKSNTPQPNRQIQTVWQRNYYEHIIRDERAYQNISNYIMNNPVKWNGDKFY